LPRSPRVRPRHTPFLSEFFAGVTFGLVLGPAYELSLIFTPQQGKYQAFACHVDTPPDDMNMTRAALRIEDLRPVDLTQIEWLRLPKIESTNVKFTKPGTEWSTRVAEWYRSFAVPGTPGAGIRGAGEDTGAVHPDRGVDDGAYLPRAGRYRSRRPPDRPREARQRVAPQCRGG